MLAQLKVASVASCRLFSRLSASLMKQSPCKHHKKSLCLWQSDADLWSGKCDRVTELSSCHISLSYCTFPLLTVRNGLWQLWLVLARHFSERAKSFGSNRLAWLTPFCSLAYERYWAQHGFVPRDSWGPEHEDQEALGWSTRFLNFRTFPIQK